MNFHRLVVSLRLIMLVVVAAMLMCGCHSTKVVEVPKTHIEYRSKTDTLLQRDSVWCHDSIWTYLKGDTVYTNKWHTEYKDRYVYKNLVDTVLKTDTITKVVKVEKTSFVQSLKDKIAEWILIALILLIALYITTKWLKSKGVI